MAAFVLYNKKVRNTQRTPIAVYMKTILFFLKIVPNISCKVLTQQGTMGMPAFVLYTFYVLYYFPLTWAFALFQFCQPCSQYYTHEKTEAYRLYSESLTHLNMIFTVLFSIECILKLMAFGPKV